MSHYTSATLSDGRGVVIEYTFKGGTGPTYSPHCGADGGDATDVVIVKAWTADEAETLVELTTDEYHRIEANILETHVDDDDGFYDPAEWRD